MTCISDSPAIVFGQTIDTKRAREFYQDALGLPVIEETMFGLTLQCRNAVLRIQKVRGFTPQIGTAIGWEVSDIEAAVKELADRGITFEHFPDMPPDEHGIWTAPDGSRIAWFKDPDGNLLSVSHSK